MPSASMNRLMDNARVRLPGAIDATILAELFSVVKEFCVESNVWQQTFDIEVTAVQTSALTAPDDFTYTLYPPTGSLVTRLISVRDANTSPVRASLVDPNAVLLERSPNEDQIYSVVAVLTVTDPVTRAGEPMAPDWIVERYTEALLDGVLARMMSQAAKPYTSPAMGALHYAMFKKAASQAKYQSQNGNVYGAQAWRYPRNFATRGRGR